MDVGREVETLVHVAKMAKGDITAMPLCRMKVAEAIRNLLEIFQIKLANELKKSITPDVEIALREMNFYLMTRIEEVQSWVDSQAESDG